MPAIAFRASNWKTFTIFQQLYQGSFVFADTMESHRALDKHITVL
jgi:hypothetical protein